MSEGKKDTKVLEDKESKSFQDLSKLVDPEVVSKVYEEYGTLAKAYEKYQKKFNSPFLNGAQGLISENEDDLNPDRLFNEAKYLHLLLAVFGFKDLQKQLLDPQQREEVEED